MHSDVIFSAHIWWGKGSESGIRAYDGKQIAGSDLDKRELCNDRKNEI